ncbi:MAG: hypothetical protein IPJ77_13840 [Planctomycetes bacterium]|nr:hypothetical protein [Planctomycetota bacterium]
MSEAQWSPDPSEAPKKKSFPKWVWFCGGGCLLALIVGIVSLVFVGNMIKKATDPALNDAALQAVLPHDPLPEEMTINFHASIGMEQFTLMDTRGFQIQFQFHGNADGARAREQMFQKDVPEFPKDLGVMSFEDMTKGLVEVQGRELTVIRMRLQFSGIMGSMMPEEAKDQVGSMMWVDLTPPTKEGEDAEHTLVLGQITRLRGKGEITDDEVRELLKPFHIGTKR